MAACTSTVYRLDAAGEVYEVVVGEADEEVQPVGAPAVAEAADCADEPFDATAWWSKQLGGAPNGALTPH